MIGQVKLTNILNSLTLDNTPRCILLLGDKGCGKHLFTQLISEKLSIPLIDATSLIDFDYILEVYQRTTPSIYMIDMDNFTEKKQNIILKFIEEPPVNAFIVLLSSQKSLLLPTIINRCSLLEFERYSKETLATFLPKDIDLNIITDVLDTPGKILNFNIDNIPALRELCVNIITKMGKAAYYNALSISDKLNYKDNYDKYDISVFFNMMKYVLLDEYIKTNSKDILKYLDLTVEYQTRYLKDKRLDGQKLIENFIGKMWVTSRCN